MYNNYSIVSGSSVYNIRYTEYEWLTERWVDSQRHKVHVEIINGMQYACTQSRRKFKHIKIKT